MNERYFRYYNPHLRRELEMLVFGDGVQSRERKRQRDEGIQHLRDHRCGCGRDWNYWRDMLPQYLGML